MNIENTKTIKLLREIGPVQLLSELVEITYYNIDHLDETGKMDEKINKFLKGGVK